MAYSYTDPNKVQIEPQRDGEEKIAYDEEGKWIASFWGDWTESQIKQAIGVANRAYEDGAARGRAEKVREIKKALDL